MPLPERKSNRERRLDEREQRARVSATEGAARSSNTNSMLQQLSTLYGIGSQSDADAQKAEAGDLALQKSRAELGYLPQQTEAALNESRARVAENQAQADYYKLRGQLDQQPDPRILSYIQDPSNIPDWIIPFMPKESQASLRELSAKKAAEREAALAREAKITEGVPPGVDPARLGGTPVNQATSAQRGDVFKANLASNPGRMVSDILGTNLSNMELAAEHGGQSIIDFVDSLLGINRPAAGTKNVPWYAAQPRKEPLPLAPLPQIYR